MNLEKLLAENMIRFGVKNLNTSNKNSIILLKEAGFLMEQGGAAFVRDMDTKGPWVLQTNGMKTKVNKGASYGKFGPQTTAAYQKNKKDYCYHKNNLLGVDKAKIINACK